MSAAVTPVPDDVPPERAVLAGTMETAVNALWDARPRVAERMALALELLADSRFDAVIGGESPFDDLPAVLPQLVSGEVTLCQRIVH